VVGLTDLNIELDYFGQMLLKSRFFR